MKHKVAIRVKAISRAGLSSMEKHGKRMDERSKSRAVNDIPPLTWADPELMNEVKSELDIGKLFDLHTEGVKWNAAAKKKVSHAIVQFPTNIEATQQNQERFMNLAREFINKNHGGSAVFAMRLDRDEYGVNKVDVFYTPIYDKTTKKGVSRWASLTKYQKQLCEKHRDELERRHGGTFSTGPRQCGIALNSELRLFLAEKGFDLAPKQEKNSRFSDWLTPEEYKIKHFQEQNAALRKGFHLIAKALEPFSELIPKNLHSFIKKRSSQPVQERNFIKQQEQHEPSLSPAASKKPDKPDQQDGPTHKM